MRIQEDRVPASFENGLVTYAAGHELVLRAARLWLTHVQVSAEQLSGITEANAWAEGVQAAEKLKKLIEQRVFQGVVL